MHAQHIAACVHGAWAQYCTPKRTNDGRGRRCGSGLNCRFGSSHIVGGVNVVDDRKVIERSCVRACVCARAHYGWWVASDVARLDRHVAGQVAESTEKTTNLLSNEVRRCNIRSLQRANAQMIVGCTTAAPAAAQIDAAAQGE